MFKSCVVSLLLQSLGVATRLLALQALLLALGVISGTLLLAGCLFFAGAWCSRIYALTWSLSSYCSPNRFLVKIKCIIARNIYNVKDIPPMLGSVAPNVQATRA